MNTTTMRFAMMKQLEDLKEKHPDALLLFRCGDFYEAYEDDAKVCADVLGIVLTKRDDIYMAGFPHHALDMYLPRLVRAGKRIAICDQLEDPKLTNKLVKRGISDIVSVKGVLDIDGATRHLMERDDLEDLYRKIDNFIADCTRQEAEEHRNAFNEIKTLIHQRMKES